LDVKASEVVGELKQYLEHIRGIENNQNLTPEDKEEKFRQVLIQIVQALNKHHILKNS
jgi:hypothetical protein